MVELTVDAQLCFEESRCGRKSVRIALKGTLCCKTTVLTILISDLMPHQWGSYDNATRQDGFDMGKVVSSNGRGVGRYLGHHYGPRRARDSLLMCCPNARTLTASVCCMP